MRAALIFFLLFGQWQTTRHNPAGPAMTAKEVVYFQTHFDEVTLAGNLKVPRSGRVRINFHDAAHPDGFSDPPSCVLDKDIVQWEITNSWEFTTFRAHPQDVIEWKCYGYMWKPGMKGKP